MRTCVTCRLELPLGNFTLDTKSKDRLKSQCKSCRSNYSKARRLVRADYLRIQSRDWARNNPDKVKDCHYRSKYGINLVEFDLLSQNQNGKCRLCDKVPKGRLVVDHSHTTGKIRGLLCRSCNGALGVLGDDEQSLLKAINYLKGA